MAAKGNTTAVVDLDVQGMGVEKAIDLISQKILKIQNQISSIVGSTDKATASFDRKLSLTVKELQKSVSQLNALQSNAEKRGFGGNERLRLQRELNAAEVKGIRDAETATRARLGAENQIRVSRERLAVSAASERRSLYENIRTEQLRLTEINKQEAALRRLAAAREKEARASQGPALFGSGGATGVFARTAAYAAAGTAIFAMAGAGREAIAVTIELEEKLAKLQAISGSTDTQMSTLSETILNVARTSAFSTSELVDASTSLAQAGFSAQGVAEALKASADLASASGSSMAQTTDIMTSAMGAFQLQETEATRVADNLTSALNKSRLNMEQVALGLQYVGQTASENNIRFEELVATIGTMSQAGIRSGSTSGTGLRQFLVDLQSPSKDLLETMKRLGISMEDIDVSTQGLPGVLRNLASAGFNSSEAYGALETRAAAAYLVLKNNIPVMESLLLAQTDTGAAARAAAKANDTFAASWQKLKNTLSEKVSEPVGFATSALKYFTDQMVRAADLNDQLDQRMKNGESWGEAYAHIRGAAEQYEAVTAAADRFAAELEHTKSKVAETTEEVVKHENKIRSLNDAAETLSARNKDLSSNSAALQIETAGLINRFEGLAKFVDMSTLSVDGLSEAIRRLRLEESQLLSDSLGQQAAELKQNIRVDAKSLTAQFKAFVDSGGRNALTQTQRDAFDLFRASPYDLKARADFRDKTSDITGDRRDVILALTGGTNRVSTSLTDYANVLKKKGLVESLSRAELVAIRGEIDQIKKPGSGFTAKGVIAKIDAEMKKPKYSANDLRALEQLRTEAQAMQVNPKPAAETKRPKGMTRSTTSIYEVQRDLDREGYMFGERVGQDSGGHKGRGHKDKRAIDVSLQAGEDRDPKVVAKQNAKALELQKKGFWVLWGGKSYNPDGSITSITGSDKHTDHMHIEEPRGGAYTREGAEERAFDEEVRRQRQAEKRIAKLKVSTADKGLKDDIEELQYAVSEAALETGKGTVKTSFKAWVEALKEQAVVDTATMDASELAEYNDELKDKVAQRAQDIAGKITDGFLALMDRMEEASDRAMANSLRPFESEISRLQAQIGGLDRASLSGKVPDYVRTLANRRLGDAQERLDGARLLTMPGRVTAQQGLVNRQEQFLKDNEGNLSAEELEKANNQLFTMKQTLFDLTSQLSGLQAAASAGQLISTDVGENVRQAARAWTELRNTQQGWAQTVGSEVAPALDFLEGGLNDMFNNMANGSRTALQAFGDMARGIIRYIQQLVIKIIASKIIELLGALLGGSVGPSFAGGSPAGGSSGAGFAGGSSTGIGTGSFVPRTTRFNGGPAPAGAPKRFIAGGRVTNGYPGRDSVNALLAQDEFVVRSAAVKSVGSAFMSDLNKNGARALRGMQQLAVLPAPAKQETNVYVVKPDAAPSMKPNDVLATIHDDILRDGATKKLIKHVAQGG